MAYKSPVDFLNSKYGQGGSYFWNYTGLGIGQSWCGAAVWASINATDNVIPKDKYMKKSSNPFWVPNIDNFCRNSKYWKKVSCKNAVKDDIVIFTWGNNSRDHVGFVRKKSGNANYIYTIEGNTSGGIVDKKTRKRGNVYSIFHYVGNNYKPTTYTGTYPTLPKKGYLAKGDTGAQVKRLQKFLKWYGSYTGTIDGSFGSGTKKAVTEFQKNEKLTVDGSFGPASLKKAKTVKI